MWRAPFFPLPHNPAAEEKGRSIVPGPHPVTGAGTPLCLVSLGQPSKPWPLWEEDLPCSPDQQRGVRSGTELDSLLNDLEPFPGLSFPTY